MNVDYFEEKSKKIIDNLDTVKEFYEDFDKEFNIVSHFKYYEDSIYKLCHPITVIKSSIKRRKLIKLKDEYDKIYKKPVVEFVTEETGLLQEDLEYAARVVKPKVVEDFVKAKKLKK